MKRQFFWVATVFFFFIAIEKTNAANANFSFTQFCGFRKGAINEYVLEKNSSGDLKKLSQLKWELNPAFYTGIASTLSFDFGKKNRNQIGMQPFFAWFGSFPSGKMYDSDWIDLNDVKNIYSISENFIDTGLFAGLNLFWKYSPLKIFAFSIEAKFQYDYIHFEAKNGYGWYGDAEHSSTGTNVSYDSSAAKFISSGKLFGIAYKKRLYSTWISAQAIFFPFNYATLKLGAGISPFAHFSSIDKHYNNNGGNFYRDVANALFCQGSFFTSIDIHNSLKTLIFSFSANKSFSPMLIGLSYIGNSSAGPFHLNSVKSGGDINYWDFTFSLTIKPSRKTTL